MKKFITIAFVFLCVIGYSQRYSFWTATDTLRSNTNSNIIVDSNAYFKKLIDVTETINTAEHYEINGDSILQIYGGTDNLGIGINAGHSYGGAAQFNVSCGFEAGKAVSTGDNNALFGYKAGLAITTGGNNTCIGAESGLSLTGEIQNTFIGFSAGENSTGNQNVLIGFGTGFNNTGDFSVMMGRYAGFNNNGNSNIFLGYQAGFNEAGSDKLYIENSNGTPLIYGDFSTDDISINGDLRVTDTLEVDYITGISDTITVDTTIVFNDSVNLQTATENYILRSNANKTIAKSVIQDDGTKIGINSSLVAGIRVAITSSLGIGVWTTSTGANTNNFAYQGLASGATTRNVGGMFVGSNSSITPAAGWYGVVAGAKNTGGLSMGVYSEVVTSNTGDNIGGFFEATNAGAGDAYVLRLDDGVDNSAKHLVVNDATGNIVFDANTTTDTVKLNDKIIWNETSSIEFDTVIIIPHNTFEVSFTTPVLLLDSSLVGWASFCYEIQSASAFLNWNSVVYPDNEAINLYYGKIASAQIAEIQGAKGFCMATSDTIGIFAMSPSGAVYQKNASVWLKLSADMSNNNGDSPVHIAIHGIIRKYE